MPLNKKSFITYVILFFMFILQKLGHHQHCTVLSSKYDLSVVGG